MASNKFTASSSDNGFFQEPFELTNVYTEDPALRDILKRYLSEDGYKSIEKDLVRLGERVVKEVTPLADLAERNPPSIKQYDHWGRRVDELILHPAWNQLQNIGCEEGLVSIPYEIPLGNLSRIYQFAKIYLFSPLNMIDCPLSMTDGMSRVITNLGTQQMKQQVLSHLISRDKNQFFTAGQWMTERKGGSDVSGTETLAYKKANQWYVDGFKWFSSATDAKYCLLLARIIDDNNIGIEGSKGLSLFLAKVKDDNNKLNGVRIHRLKDKIGTKSLPTAELELKNMKVELIGPINKGIPNISLVLMITRVHCALTSSAGLRRAFLIAMDYACKRKVGNKKLCEIPLHVTTLAKIENKIRQTTQLAFYSAYLLGQYESDQCSLEDQLMFRLCIPIAKMWCSEYSVEQILNCLEALGGQGYMEETGIGKIFRDCLVNRIWEGTSNVMGLDVFRCIKNSRGQTWYNFKKVINNKVLNNIKKFSIGDYGYDTILKKIKIIQSSMTILDQLLSCIIKNNSYDSFQMISKALTICLGNILVITLLLEQAAFSKENEDISIKLNHNKDILTLKYCFMDFNQVLNPILEYLPLDINSINNKNNKDNNDNIKLGYDFGDGFSKILESEYNNSKLNETKHKINIINFKRVLELRYQDDYDLIHPTHHKPQLLNLNSKL